MLRAIIYFHVYIKLDFPIKYRNASVPVNQNAHVYIKTVNMVVFLDKRNE